MDNPLFDAYIQEKLKDEEIEITEKAEKWVHILRKYYLAAIKEGFTPRQAMHICDELWKRSDKLYWREKRHKLENPPRDER